MVRARCGCPPPLVFFSYYISQYTQILPQQFFHYWKMYNMDLFSLFLCLLPPPSKKYKNKKKQNFSPLWSSGLVNIRHSRPPTNAIFIGRPSKWGNPYKIKIGREKAIEEYENYLYSSGLINDIAELANLTLVCFCTPLPCHGNVLLKILYGLKISEME